MSIFNRRNAVIGWTVWQVGKRAAKRKAREAVPSVDPETKRPNASAIAAAAAAAAGALLFWRKRRSGEPPEEE